LAGARQAVLTVVQQLRTSLSTTSSEYAEATLDLAHPVRLAECRAASNASAYLVHQTRNAFCSPDVVPANPARMYDKSIYHAWRVEPWS
jgi:hypothetical protein